MDCPDVQQDLIPYHFGALDAAAQEAFDAHLLGCAACLRAYLSLKRAVAAGETLDERPSDAMHLRLRAEVARTFRRSPAQRLRGFLNRPIPLYQSLAAALLLVVLTGFLRPLWHLPPSRAPAGVALLVDTAREATTNQLIY